MVVRASGTEQLVRVMVEAEDEADARAHTRRRSPAVVAGAARRLSRPADRRAATLDPSCAASWATWGPTRPSRSSSKGSGDWSTAATTPRASPSSTVVSRS